MKKYLKYVVFSMVMFLTLCFSVSADYCTECAEKNGGKCGLCGYSCSINDDGVCTINSHDQELWDEAAKSSCSGYDDRETCGEALDGTCVWNGKDTCLEKGAATCLDFKDSTSCRTSPHASCVWVDNKDYDFLDKGYCNVDNLLYVGCGGASDIPVQVPALISMLVNLLKIATPIILIFISMITLVKTLSAGKEDEIKKATSSLTKKMIAAALVFFVVAIVQFVISKVAEDDVYEGFDDCLNCFLNNSCSENMYYKTVISGQDWCTDISDGDFELCNPDE